MAQNGCSANDDDDDDNDIRLEGLKKTTKKSQDSRWPGRDSNEVPPEYKSEALPPKLTCSAEHIEGITPREITLLFLSRNIFVLSFCIQ
jgi:hypothetical protein